MKAVDNGLTVMKGKPLLRFHEGERLTAYQDSLGFWTIGVGHLLPRPRSPEWRGYRITQAQSDALFEEDWNHHVFLLQKYAPWAMQFDEVRRYVMIDMTFNLGIEPFDNDGFKDWPIFVGQLQRRDWRSASANMRSTLWARQVKGRAVRLSRMIETGQWPREPGVPVIS
jgi:lysozyme